MICVRPWALRLSKFFFQQRLLLTFADIGRIRENPVCATDTVLKSKVKVPIPSLFPKGGGRDARGSLSDLYDIGVLQNFLLEQIVN